jgi:hypothetical protein
MKGFMNSLIPENGLAQKVKNLVSKYRLVLPVAIIGLLLILTASAQKEDTATTTHEDGALKFRLAPPAGQVAGCFPNATARVTVFPREERRGVDTLDLKAEGLPPHTEFTVFLTELPNPPFNAVEYIGDFTTNAAGRGSMRADTIINEAFVSTVVGGVRTRADLNYVVVWFADPADDDFCFAPGGTGPVTPFDGDGDAGVTVLSSANFLPGAPLP